MYKIEKRNEELKQAFEQKLIFFIIVISDPLITLTMPTPMYISPMAINLFLYLEHV